MATYLQGLTAFDSDGFSLGTGSQDNNSGQTYVAWNWKAGGAPSATNSETSGAMTANSVSLNGALQSSYTPSGSPSIYPTKMSINTTNGFSIISYTSPGTNNDESIPHGLSQRPDMVIVKNLDAVRNWDVWTDDLQSGYDLRLNTLDAETASRWSTTIPTSSLVTLLDDYEVEESDEFIAYCFHSIEGYSQVGLYTGNNNAAGPFIYTGFKPNFVMIKRKDSALGGANWYIMDDKRPGYNVDNDILYANLPNIEGDTDLADIVSNGIKIRTADDGVNASSGTYIYLAFAESPFKTSNAG